MNSSNFQFLTLIFSLIVFPNMFAAELVSRMQLLSASLVRKEDKVKILENEYYTALKIKDYDVKKLERIKQSLFDAMDELSVIKKKIAEEYMRIKSNNKN